jgi:hypothetical protein
MESSSRRIHSSTWLVLIWGGLPQGVNAEPPSVTSSRCHVTVRFHDMFLRRNGV